MDNSDDTLEFTPEQITELERIAGLNYTLSKIAMYFDIDVDRIYEEYNNTESKFRYHYDRGRLLVQAKLDIASLDSAEKGNITAIQRMDKQRKEQDQLIIKEAIFGRPYKIQS